MSIFLSEASMATAKHWTIEPDAEATIKVSLIHLFLAISSFYVHKGIVHACGLIGTFYYTCVPFEILTFWYKLLNNKLCSLSTLRPNVTVVKTSSLSNLIVLAN